MRVVFMIFRVTSPDWMPRSSIRPSSVTSTPIRTARRPHAAGGARERDQFDDVVIREDVHIDGRGRDFLRTGPVHGVDPTGPRQDGQVELAGGVGGGGVDLFSHVATTVASGMGCLRRIRRQRSRRPSRRRGSGVRGASPSGSAAWVISIGRNPSGARSAEPSSRSGRDVDRVGVGKYQGVPRAADRRHPGPGQTGLPARKWFGECASDHGAAEAARSSMTRSVRSDDAPQP